MARGRRARWVGSMPLRADADVSVCGILEQRVESREVREGGVFCTTRKEAIIRSLSFVCAICFGAMGYIFLGVRSAGGHRFYY
jgi:hypothetical protein